MNICVYLNSTRAKKPFTAATKIGDLDPTNLDNPKYFYDPKSGRLFFYVVQDTPQRRGAFAAGQLLR